MGRPTKPVVVSAAAVRAMGRRNIRASARLAGREVPEGHLRSAAVAKFLAEHSSGSTDAHNAQRNEQTSGVDKVRPLTKGATTD
jgi:hypothetical protein